MSLKNVPSVSVKPELLIGYTRNREALSAKAFNSYLLQLPKAHMDQVLKFRFWSDTQSCLFGKLLLMNILKERSESKLTLSDIKYTQYKRPFFAHSSIDFNISHSGDLVVCAVFWNGRVGIDIENIKKINYDPFVDFFSFGEIKFITDGTDDCRSFYTIWTKKEAVIKANGKGFYIPLKEVDVRDSKATVENQAWFIKDVHISDEYCCHVCIDKSPWPEIEIKEYSY